MRSAGLQVIYKDKGEKETYEKTGSVVLAAAIAGAFSRLRQHKTSRDNSCSRHKWCRRDPGRGSSRGCDH